MAKQKDQDPAFEIDFYESVLRRAPRYAEVVEILGGLYTKTGRIADGLRMDRILVRLQPGNDTAHYNLACSLALTRRKAAALRALRQAIDLGYADHEWMEQDPDLDNLKGHPEFAALLERLRLRRDAERQ
jgi:tetratricopeptide (TPR) repeat protein